MVNGDGNIPIRASFTRDDQQQCQAYVAQRAILYELWDLATVYPNVASRIQIRIRKADPKRDYHYDAGFGDAALIVMLSWIDAREACRFLSCNDSYPRGERCRAGDDPRIFPSGDHTSVTACEPACFMMVQAFTERGDALGANDLRERYSSTRAHVMSAHTGHFRTVDAAFDDNEVIINAVAGAATTTTPSSGQTSKDDGAATQRAADMPQTYYSPTTDQCEIANLALLAYVTKPYTRSIEGENDSVRSNDPDTSAKSVCRLTNFHIGDDVVRTTTKLDDEGQTYEIETGRHSKTYCNGFYKSFDESNASCYEPLWERILSYTFVGSALVRLARHALNGGDQCDSMLKTEPSRREVRVQRDVPLNIRSRKHWFSDVNTNWRLPPPNILLSDLGILELGQVWSNVDNSVRAAEPRDYEAPTNACVASEIAVARKLLQRQPTTTTTTTSEQSSPSPQPRRRRRRSASQQQQQQHAATTPTPKESLVDFDRLYAAYDASESALGSVQNRQFWSQIVQMLGETTAHVAVGAIATKLTRSAVNRTLRYIGRDLTGNATRALVNMGIRVTSARMVSSVLTRFSTRIMLALGTTASGIGVVVGVVELLAAVLDFMILFGWDPGNYNAEFDNAVYDDLAIGWLKHKRYFDVATVDPYMLLKVFQRNREGAISPDAGGSADDDENDDASRSSRRTEIRDRSQVPWYFASFDAAVEAILQDSAGPAEASDDDAATATEATSYRAAALMQARPRAKLILGGAAYDDVDDDDDATAAANDDVLVRIRPILTDHVVTTTFLASTHYFRHRGTNSFGQTILHETEPTVKLNDETIATAVRDNELASFLSSAHSTRAVPRDALLGAARRNLASKTASAGLGFVLATTSLLALFALSVVALVSRRRGRRANSHVAIAVAVTALLFVLPLLLCTFIMETCARGDNYDRSFDRQTFTDPTNVIGDGYDTDFVDESCDAVTQLFRLAIDRFPGNEFTLADVANVRKELRVILNV